MSFEDIILNSEINSPTNQETSNEQRSDVEVWSEILDFQDTSNSSEIETSSIEKSFIENDDIKYEFLKTPVQKNYSEAVFITEESNLPEKTKKLLNYI